MSRNILIPHLENTDSYQGGIYLDLNTILTQMARHYLGDLSYTTMESPLYGLEFTYW